MNDENAFMGICIQMLWQSSYISELLDHTDAYLWKKLQSIQLLKRRIHLFKDLAENSVDKYRLADKEKRQFCNFSPGTNIINEALNWDSTL